MTVSELVQKFIKDNPVMVFSKTYCPYCTKVKELLKSLNVTYHVEELDQRQDGKEIQDQLAAMTSQNTVPNVFIKGKHIGGCDKTLALHDKGELMKLIQ